MQRRLRETRTLARGHSEIATRLGLTPDPGFRRFTVGPTAPAGCANPSPHEGPRSPSLSILRLGFSPQNLPFVHVYCSEWLPAEPCAHYGELGICCLSGGSMSQLPEGTAGRGGSWFEIIEDSGRLQMD